MEKLAGMSKKNSNSGWLVRQLELASKAVDEWPKTKRANMKLEGEATDNKELFVKALKTIESMNLKYEKVVEALDIDGVFTFGMDTIDIVIELLSALVGDTEEWVSWWVWDTNFGKSEDLITVIERYGKKVEIKTAENLFDFLSKDKK